MHTNYFAVFLVKIFKRYNLSKSTTKIITSTISFVALSILYRYFFYSMEQPLFRILNFILFLFFFGYGRFKTNKYIDEKM